MMREVNICEYLKQRHGGDILVDLRSEVMYSFGTISGAVNIPVERIEKLYELPKDKTVCLFCQVGEISGQFARLLSDAGYDTCDLSGGYREYIKEKFKEENL